VLSRAARSPALCVLPGARRHPGASLARSEAVELRERGRGDVLVRLTLGSTVTTAEASAGQEARGDKDKERTVAQTSGVVVGGSSCQNLRARAELSRVWVGRRGTMDWGRYSSGRRPF
jgi:hypothetical protein